MAGPTDPRVRAVSSAARGTAVSAAVNFSGPNSDSHHSWVRKRAFRRATQRAIMHGGTWYRGVWRSANSLGVTPVDSARSGQASARTAPTLQGRRPRVRVLSYNIGGMSSDLYDVLVDWLKRQQCADIVLLQEVHYGLGRGESTWTRDGWHFIASASPDTRYAGVCICVSAKLVKQEALDYQTWVAGRIYMSGFMAMRFLLMSFRFTSGLRKLVLRTLQYRNVYNSGKSLTDCWNLYHAAMFW